MKTNSKPNTSQQSTQLVQIRPRPVRSAPDAPKREQRLWCRKYDACLTTAGREDWPAFSCHRCEAYEEVAIEELVERDHDRLLLLARVIRLGEEDFAGNDNAEAVAA